MTWLKPKSRLRLRAFWAEWSPAATAGLIAAALLFALVRILTQAGH
jgi:hypothetical protein